MRFTLILYIIVRIMLQYKLDVIVNLCLIIIITQCKEIVSIEKI